MIILTNKSIQQLRYLTKAYDEKLNIITQKYLVDL